MESNRWWEPEATLEERMEWEERLYLERVSRGEEEIPELPFV